MSHPAPLTTLVETSLYGDDLVALEAFYHGVLGLPVVARDPERHLFLQVGPGQMLLLFRADTTLQPGDFPRHGTRGPGHAAFGIAADQRENWRAQLLQSGIAIEAELDWPRGGKSIYFRDPAGNSIELITPGVWGLPDGW
ncbi:MAG: VOC family protein [Planctomyces sp.]|nr:VOC family protein [Planctomyces sp.]